MLQVPQSVKDLESKELSFEDEPDDLLLDNPDERRSPGRMIEDDGNRSKEVQSLAKMKPGKLERLVAGNYLAYTGLEKKRKICHVGKVQNVSRREESVVVHKHKPVSDGRLRLKWEPLYIEDGTEVLGSGSKPSEETIQVKRILFPVPIHDGVLGHAAARRLDHMGYVFDAKELEYEQGCFDLKIMKPMNNSLAEKLERFCFAGQALPSVGANDTSHRVKFESNIELQKWLQLGRVDFAELFRGRGQATIRVREAGCSAAEGFDKHCITYERSWHLETRNDQADIAWFLVYVLKPRVAHLGTPCTHMAVIGDKKIGADTQSQNEFSKIVLTHQEEVGQKASVETPKGSSLYN